MISAIIFDLETVLGHKEKMEELLVFIKEKNWLAALATDKCWIEVENDLEDLEQYATFDITVTGEEVEIKKPDPEIYFLTAKKLGVDPEDCFVIESLPAGLTISKIADENCGVVVGEIGDVIQLLTKWAK